MLNGDFHPSGLIPETRSTRLLLVIGIQLSFAVMRGIEPTLTFTLKIISSALLIHYLQMPGRRQVYKLLGLALLRPTNISIYI